MAYLDDADEYEVLTRQALTATTYPKSTDFDTLNSTFSDVLNGRLLRSSDYTTNPQLRIAKLIVSQWIFKLGKSEVANQIYRSPALAAQSFVLDLDPSIEYWIKILVGYTRVTAGRAPGRIVF